MLTLVRFSARAGLAVAFVLASCNLDGTDPRPGTPGLTVVSGGSGSDTVRAKLNELLTVQLRDSAGWPVAREWVGFQVMPPPGDAEGVRQAALVCKRSDTGCLGYTGNEFVADTTDGDGKVAIVVVMGTVAGSAKVVLTAGYLTGPFRFSDTVSYDVRPGNPGGIRIGVRDSSAYVGNGYRIGANGTDRYKNVRPDDPVTYLAFGSAATISNTGDFLATTIGRSGAIATSGAFSDTAWISVPPRGTIAAFDVGDAFGVYPAGIVMVRLDGSGYRMLARTTDPYYGTFPDWTASGQVVYETGGYSVERLYVADTLGQQSPRLTPGTTPTRGEQYGAGARDGSIFFSALDTIAVAGIWRVNAAGAMPVRVGPNPVVEAGAFKPSPAPDGQRLAYSYGTLNILTVANGSTKAIVVTEADAPRWSPLGDWIVFNADTTLYMIRPDGTGRQRVGPARYYFPRADWSPDGNWLIARTRNRTELIDVATGATIPLPWATRIVRPAWRP